MNVKISIWVSAACLGTLLGAGCAIPQTSECTTYVDCQAHYDETYSLAATNTDDYTPEGLCWTNENRAAGCTESCDIASEVLLRSLNDTGDDPGPCAR